MQMTPGNMLAAAETAARKANIHLSCTGPTSGNQNGLRLVGCQRRHINRLAGGTQRTGGFSLVLFYAIGNLIGACWR